MKVYQKLAQKVNWFHSTSKEYQSQAESDIEKILDSHLPQGSGWFITLNLTKSKANKIIMACEYQNMDEHGGYDTPDNFSIIITPDLAWDFNTRLNFHGVYTKYSQINREYYLDTLHEALNTHVNE